MIDQFLIAGISGSLIILAVCLFTLIPKLIKKLHGIKFPTLSALKVPFLIIFILLLCIPAYYFYVLKPAQIRELEVAYLENKIQCQKDGYEYWTRVQKENERLEYFQPEYKFNQKLNTCLIQITHQNYDGTSEVSEIIDIYQNSTLARYSQRFWNDDWQDQISTEEEWNLKVNEYLTN